MGFEFYYRSTRPVMPAEALTIKQAADELTRGHTWLCSEPLILSSCKEDGHLEGGSKPTFQPRPDDAASAELEGLPDGTILDLIKILRQLSESHDIDWEISHDYSEGPIGFIRSGVCDSAVLTQAEGFASAIEMLGDTMDEFDQPSNIPRASSPTGQTGWDNEDDGPPILKFRPSRQ
jgi:hypothetical protein